MAAPGVDLLLPSPDEKYQVTSVTSFAAAYVSGIAALIVERNPGVSPEIVRRILTDTARDLGPKDSKVNARIEEGLRLSTPQ